MITKAQCTKVAQDYSTGVAVRLEAALAAAAASGVVGVTSYPYPSNVPAGFLTDIRNSLVAAGWTVTVDNVNFLVTIS